MSELFSIILFLAAVVCILFINKEKLKMLKVSQMVGIALSYLISIGIAASFIYFGGNWIAGKMPYTWLSWIVFIFIIAIVMIGISFLLSKLVGKITGGAFDSK